MNALKRLFCKADRAMLVIRSVSQTHVGRVRTLNEDRILDRPDLCLWAVADGMGGHSAGDVAAEFLVKELAAWREEKPAEALREGLISANRKLFAITNGTGGSTLVAMQVSDSQGHICWAGDSRAYLIRGDKLRQLTRDHSLVQQLLDAGSIDEAAAHRHPQANVITSALGVTADPVIETITLDIARGDRVLLCSDGLSRSLSKNDAAGSLALPALAERLLSGALHRDGSDNVSLILIEFA